MATGRVPTTANSPLTAKGDLFGYSTAPARLAVGNDGETIVADSSTSTGLRYTAGTVQANPVINSAMQIAQYGTSTALASSVKGYACDRWKAVDFNSASVISRQATGDTTNLPNIQYGLRFQRNSGQTGTTLRYIAQSLETINSIPFAGKTVTLSFYAKRGADFSGSFTGTLYSGTGTDQNWIDVAYTGQQTIANISPTLTTTYQRFTATFVQAVPTTATELAIVFNQAPTGTAGANDWFEVTGVQIDVGSVALPFRTNGATIQGETSACQRYYQKIASGNNSPIGYGSFLSSTLYEVGVHFPVEMRANPTIDATTGTSYYTTNSIVQNLNSLLIDQTTTRFVVLYNNTNVAGATAGQSTWVRGNNASTYLALSAEL